MVIVTKNYMVFIILYETESIRHKPMNKKIIN